jgi:hypothetical protein
MPANAQGKASKYTIPM